MLTIQFRKKGVEDAYKTSLRLESQMKQKSGLFVKEMAELIVADIRSNWSGTQQAIGSGTPPAIKTGNLDSSIKIDEQGRSSGGQFASSQDVTLNFIRIDTAEGSDPDGRGNYAQALEDPDYYNLPFLAPAMERAKSHIQDVARRTLKP